MSNRELIGTMYASSAFTSVNYIVNPGNKHLFPWLSGIALSYEKYQFTKLVVSVHSVISAMGNGYTAISFDPDVRDRVPASLIEMMGTKLSKQGPVRQNLALAIPAGGQRLVRDCDTTSELNGGGQQLYDCGQVHLHATMDGSNLEVGLIYVDYEVVLTTPSLRSGMLDDESPMEMLTFIGPTLPAQASTDALLSEVDPRIWPEEKIPQEQMTPLEVVSGLPSYNPSNNAGSRTALVNKGTKPFSGTVRVATNKHPLAPYGPWLRDKYGNAKASYVDVINQVPTTGVDYQGNPNKTIGHMITVKDLLPGEGISFNWESVQTAAKMVFEVAEVAAPLVNAMWNFWQEENPWYCDADMVARGQPALFGEQARRARLAAGAGNTAAVSVTGACPKC